MDDTEAAERKPRLRDVLPKLPPHGEALYGYEAVLQGLVAEDRWLQELPADDLREIAPGHALYWYQVHQNRVHGVYFAPERGVIRAAFVMLTVVAAIVAAVLLGGCGDHYNEDCSTDCYVNGDEIFPEEVCWDDDFVLNGVAHHQICCLDTAPGGDDVPSCFFT